MDQLSAYINKAIGWYLVAVAVVTPLLFLDKTSEFYEMPKIIFLVASVLILLLLWSFSWIIQGKVTITRTPLDIPLLLILLVIIVSAALSGTKFISIYGNFPRLHASAIAAITYILLYFIAASALKTQAQIRNVFYGLIGSAVVVALFTIAAYFGAFLPWPFVKFIAFTPTGSAFSTAALMILVLPFTLLSIINPNKLIPQIISIVLTTILLVCLVLIANIALLIIAIIAIGLVLFISKQSALNRYLPLLLVPVVIAGIVLLGGFIKNSNNILNQKRTEYAKFQEIQLPFNFSWKVSASAFRDEPFKGTGPGTYLFNFTSYKPAEMNIAKINGIEIWNLRFDSAYNEYLQFLGTLGLLGFLGLAFFSVVAVGMAWSSLSKKEPPTATANLSNSFIPALSVSAIVSVLLLFVHVTTPVTTVTSLLILAMLMVVHKSISGKVEEWTLAIRASKGSGTGTDANLILAVILFIPILFFVIFAGVQTFQAVRADYYHRYAFTIPVSNGIGIYNNLQKAVSINNKVDAYHSDLAQVNFALANAIAASKGPTEASPSGSLTDADKQNIQTFISQSINESRIAASLSPRSAQNWEVLASIYRQITGIAENALTFSLDAYGRAIQQDPMNPQLRLNVGGIYFAAKNYDLAVRFFTDSVNLKPDFANGYYNLAVALKEKGDLVSAQASIEQVIRLVDPKSPDYKTATAMLAELKAAIKEAAETGQQAQTTSSVPPAAEQNGALQNEDLPQIDVLDKNQPDVATPEAVKK